MIPSGSRCRRNWRVLEVLILAMIGTKSLAFSSSPVSLPTTSSSSATTTTSCAVIGCGVLGTRLCEQILANPELSSWKVTGITKSTQRHESLLQQMATERFQVETLDSLRENNQRYHHVVFCAPPSGFEDYPKAVEEAITSIWAGPKEGGVFVFTSSGGIYGPGDGETVTETTPITADGNPRSAKLINAEQACLVKGGACLRLAGLYLLERGAHSYWLNNPEGKVSGRADGIVNLLHYEDAASACLAALQAGPEAVSGKVFLISDGHPTTRRGIVESALQSNLFRQKAMPEFVSQESDPKGKTYDGSWSNQVLQWQPKYISFDDFMSSQS